MKLCYNSAQYCDVDPGGHAV